MEYLFSLNALISLLTLTILEIVLGVDNVIFVSIIMGRMPQSQQAKARRVWMIGGITVRVLLLIALGWLIKQKGNPLFSAFGKGFDLASLVMIAGGLFLLYKTVKEIHGKLEGEDEEFENVGKKPASFVNAIWQILIVDMVFSFDSIITAVGIANHLEVMILAVVVAMFIMFLFSKKIADFINQHPTLKMLALSFLVMVGMVLIIEGWSGEKAEELHLKNYVYFGMVFSFAVELLNMKMRKSVKRAKMKSPGLEDAGLGDVVKKRI